MSDKIKIIQDISLLYELALSVGSSLDPRENCHNFLRTLISRKSLNFGAVWLRRDGPDSTVLFDLFFIHPNFREAQTSVTCSHFMVQELGAKPYVSISSQHPQFEALLQEKKVGKGSYAIFSLGELGILKLFASNRPEGFPEMEMAQLKQVVDKLKVSLDGCFAHIRLKEETEHRLLTQKALEESEGKLRRIIDSSLDAVVSVDAEGNTMEWNTQAEKMFGYTREEAFGLPLRNIILPERHRERYRQTLKEYIENSDESIVNKRYEIKCIRKDGNEFLAELSFTADKSDKSILFVGFLRDITAQRKAKQDIEQARIRMENLISSLQAGILLEDSHRRIALVNKAFCDIFSIPIAPELLVGTDCSQSAEQSKHLFMHPDAFVYNIENALRNKKLVENEILFMADGRVLERDFIPLISEGKYLGHLWQYRDITERRNAEQAIRESEEKYRGVLENMELGLLEVDNQERIIRVNNAFCQMVGYTQEELIGQFALEVVVPAHSRKTMVERMAERRVGQSSVYEMQLQRKDGTLVWGLISGAPIKNAQGQVVGSIGIQFDLTERKALENALAEAKLTADRARMAERRFLTHMSHEIRTPINAVIGMTHLLFETHPDHTQQEYLNSLRFSADSLLGIIDNILDLSKIDAGEIEFEHRPFDLEYLIDSLLRAFQFKIEEKDIQIIESFDPAIQNLVVGDPTRTNQILTNLLGNALKFTPKGVVGIHTRLLDGPPGQYSIEFRVQDTGIGIPEDKWETIFEYFKQADVQINRKFGGTGLGLTIVKQLVEMQGGTIEVESKINVGSEFIVQLHFGDSGIPVSIKALPEELSLTGKSLKGLRFLIVEDNLLNQKLICKTIESWECTFEVANNGLEALSKTATSRFDVILMDIHMPEMDGCETTLAIRKDGENPNREVPIFALTAAAMADEKRKAFEVGMNGFLTKPISPRMLQEHLLRSIPKLALQEPADVNLPMEVSDSDNRIDLSYLLDMSNGDIHFVGQIIDAFLAETPAALQNLELLANRQEWLLAGKVLHKLKPSFAMLGMHQLHQKTVQIETAIKQGSANAGQLAVLMAQLIAETNVMMRLLAGKKTPD